MRTLIHLLLAAGLLQSSWGAPPLLPSASLDTAADRVFGQPDFISNAYHPTSQTSLGSVEGTVVDRWGNLFVSDFNRILEFDNPAASDLLADRVFGQPDFTTNTANYGGVSANSLYVVWELAVDALGNLYVVDRNNNRVLEYDDPTHTDLVADRVFGQPDFASNAPANGGVSAHSFYYPAGVALDGHGNLYVSDSLDNRILEFDNPLTSDANADRVIGQIDFSGSSPNGGGGISAFGLHAPWGLSFDVQGNMFAADFGNNRVLEYFSPLTTDLTADRVFGQPDFASNASSNVSATTLTAPSGTAVDIHGGLYVADSGFNRVLEYTPPFAAAGTAASRVFGQPDFTQDVANNGGVSANSLNSPESVSLDSSGNLYVDDVGNHRLLEYFVPDPHPLPVVTSISPSSVAAGSPAFYITVKGSGFVADASPGDGAHTGSGSVLRLNSADQPTLFQNSGSLFAYVLPQTVAAGGPFPVTVVTDAPGGGSSTVINLPLYRRIPADRKADGVEGQPDFTNAYANSPLVQDGSARLNNPSGVAFSVLKDTLFVADTDNNRVLIWGDPAFLANAQPALRVLGQPNFVFNNKNTGGRSAASLSGPHGLAVDSQGDLFVADTFNNRVLVFSPPYHTGDPAIVVFGQGGSFTSAAVNNGGVSANSLFNPYAVAVDSQDNLYIADTLNSRVLEYDQPLATDTIADRVYGQPDFTSIAPNNPFLYAGTLYMPRGVAVDGQGRLFIVDTLNARVVGFDQPLTQGRAANLLFGQLEFKLNTANYNGVSAYGLNLPTAAAVNATGNLYVADTGNNRLLEYNAPFGLLGPAAAQVFGQPDFSTSTANFGGVSAASLNGPAGLAFDRQRRLLLADTANHRLLLFDEPVSAAFLPMVSR